MFVLKFLITKRQIKMKSLIKIRIKAAVLTFMFIRVYAPLMSEEGKNTAYGQIQLSQNSGMGFKNK